MGSTWGNNIKLSIFGESHGRAIGVVIDGLPAGIKLDLDYIDSEMKRRAPGRNKMSTPRKEGDKYEILSGYFNDRTTGTPLSSIIYNTNQRSRDYDAMKSIMRPSHADYTGHVRYSGFNDYRGGGHFSGRITAPLVFAGAIAKQILLNEGIVIGSHIKSIGNIEEDSFNMVDIDTSLLERLTKMELPVLNDTEGDQMKECILKAREDNDSVGGVVETAAINLPEGLGNPFFDTVESKLGHMLFSVPAVKGVEFGSGFDMASMKGSEANDELYICGDKVKTYSNNNGGVLGGITNGMPIIFRTAIKPTASIGKSQRTIDIATGGATEIEVDGRHDPCIVPRVVPVIEAVAAITLLDFMLERKARYE